MDISKSKLFNKIRKYDKIIFVFIFSIIIYIIAAIYNHTFVRIMSVTSYLTWHTIFEFASILVSFSVFTVTYFIYEESASLKMIIFGCAFLTMGFLDAFHTFSYKGMADFFIANITANRATTLWILSRFLGSLGLMLAIFTPSNIVSSIRKEFFAAATTISTFILFFIATYYPNFFPTMFVEEQGLTDTKVFIEYLIIFILGITFIMTVIEYRKSNHNREYKFMISLVLLVFSEFAFTSYGSVYDAFNYIGHLYKAIAFMILYKAIYMENVSTPYKEMKRTRNKLKEYSDNLG